MPTKKLAAFALAAAVAAVATFAVAQDVTITPDPSLSSLTPEQMVEKRQETMKSNGATLKAAGAATGAEAVTAAETLIANFSNLTVLFPEGSIVGDSNALPVIWEKNADFQAILTKAVATATAMKVAAEAGDAAAYGAAVKTIGSFCGECHQTFRKPQS